MADQRGENSVLFSLKELRRLEEAGIIRGYHADIDARELGFEVQVRAGRFDKARQEAARIGGT